jgi:hypothetical protein
MHIFRCRRLQEFMLNSRAIMFPWQITLGQWDNGRGDNVQPTAVSMTVHVGCHSKTIIPCLQG